MNAPCPSLTASTSWDGEKSYALPAQSWIIAIPYNASQCSNVSSFFSRNLLTKANYSRQVPVSKVEEVTVNFFMVYPVSSTKSLTRMGSGPKQYISGLIRILKQAPLYTISLSTTYKQDAVGVRKCRVLSIIALETLIVMLSTLASLESGGAHALAFSSGSAITATVLQSLGPNAHVVSVNDIYGGTFRYLVRVASETQGLETSYLDLEKVDDEAFNQG
ncbi:hypothetical protein BJ138DRAFT_1222882 [Hygrophoropsis aurantiaca]|uniref:Uncharacterized protein n=1 Tax=Hygrophoropsis aurantiaca TaxID=72124 RepID=A0ACB8A067_9AGAM|nr:hypothetical protein BJ138DRAFT_1222882 [Hygrophoropsis aurantiaca]